MIEYWRYIALTRTGHEVTGRIVGSKRKVVEYCSKEQIYLIDLKFDLRRFLCRRTRKVKLSDAFLLRFFDDIFNMQASGMSISQILCAMQDGEKGARVMDVLIYLEEGVKSGQSLAQAITSSGAFPWIVSGTIYAGERAGRLNETFMMLRNYFKHQRDFYERLNEALLYPGIVFLSLVVVMLFMGINVIPKLQGLLPTKSLSQGGTVWVLWLSSFLRHSWLAIVVLPFSAFGGMAVCRKQNRLGFELFLYKVPIIGNFVKELDFAFYFLNLSILLKSGVSLLKAISDLNVIYPNQTSLQFLGCRDFMYGGMSFWESAKMNPFFPSVVVFSLRRGEETARLDEYCEKLADYFDKRISGKMEGMVNLIQPILLSVGGLFLALIAFAFLVPIYSSLTSIAGGY